MVRWIFILWYGDLRHYFADYDFLRKGGFMENKYTVLKNYFGYASFREGQELLIDSILAGRDVLGIMPTGAGKSICYQVPAMLLGGITIVVSPLISLMTDQVQALNQAGIHAAYINSSLTEGQISKALYFAAQGRYKIIYVAPERLETYEFMQFAQQADLSMLTVDEAHCISQWGQDFRPSYLKIVQFVKHLSKRPVISAFTATATERVKDDIACVLGLVKPQILITGFDRKNLYFAVETLGRQRQKDAYVLDYIKNHPDESGVVYCATRKKVEEVCGLLLEAGVPAAKYHAGLGNEERRQSQEDFTYDKTAVMVATNAFGMGIDKSNIRYVIHYNMPQSMENYYQEAGRAGRDGGAAECILLYSAQDMMINRFLLEEGAEEVREQDEMRLRRMQGYCTTKNCLREYILSYFGEYGTKACGNCSNCQGEFEEVDVTAEAKKIIYCIREMGQRYGMNVVVGTLLGAGTAKLREYNVARYSMYGNLKGWPEADVKEIMGLLLEEGFLVQTKDKYALLKLTEQAAEWMEGGKNIILKRAKKTPGDRVENPDRISGGRKSDILNSKGLELFELLRQLRMEIAREENVPPYVVFADKTLMEMCIKLPLDEAGLRQVSGVGESRCKRYGQQFLDKIQDFTGGRSIKLYFGEMAEAAAGMQRTGTKEKRVPKEEFFLTAQQYGEFCCQQGCLLTELAVALSELRDEERVKKLTGAQIQRFLEAQGYMEEKRVDGRWKKIVFAKGQEAGLYCAPRMSRSGTEYEDVYCDERAQKMIAKHFCRDV